MAIDRVHWKVGDLILVIGQGFFPIESIDDTGVSWYDPNRQRTRTSTYDQVVYKSPAESKSWKRGDVVYVGGVTPVVIEYLSRDHRDNFVDYIEWNGDWDSECAYAENLTANPLDPILVKKAENRDQRIAYEAVLNKISDAAVDAPQPARRWIHGMIEAFEQTFNEELLGEKSE